MNNIILRMFSNEKEEVATYVVSPELLYERLRELLPKLLQLNNGGDKKSLLFKTAIKGIFLMYGDYILEQVYQSKDHPKPGKKDDIVLWYLDLFTRVLVSHAASSEYHLSGETIDKITFLNSAGSQPVASEEDTTS